VRKERGGIVEVEEDVVDRYNGVGSECLMAIGCVGWAEGKDDGER
jgi:hypothetical protein